MGVREGRCAAGGGGVMSTRRGPKWSPFTNWDTGPSNIDVTFAQPVYYSLFPDSVFTQSNKMLQVRIGAWGSLRRGL